MLTQFELKILNNLKCIISILESNSFLKFFREVIFLSAYHKSCVNEEGTLYFYIEYIDDRCDIVTTNKKKLQEDAFFELNYSNVLATLEKQIEKSFFEDKSIAGVFNLNSFDNNLIAKYNLDISDNKDFFYNITELKDWNLELVNDKMNSFRDKYALNKRNIAEAHLNQYIDNIKNRIYNMELLYDKQIQL